MDPNADQFDLEWEDVIADTADVILTAAVVDASAEEWSTAIARAVTRSLHDDGYLQQPGEVVELRTVIANLQAAAGDAWAASDAARHARHGAWRRWRLTHRLVSWAYTLGVISGSGSDFSPSCPGCVTVYWRGRRPYLLGRSRDWWWCLLVGRHRRREMAHEEGGLCSVCLPCWVPGCGSTDPHHDAWACDVARSAARAGELARGDTPEAPDRPCLPWADPEWVRLVGDDDLEAADRYLLDSWRAAGFITDEQAAGDAPGGAGDGTR